MEEFEGETETQRPEDGGRPTGLTAGSAPRPPRPARSRELTADALAVFLLVLLAVLTLVDALAGGRVLLPSELLRHMEPWAGAVSLPESPPPWNPLLWDGIAQFYPWRHFAAEWVGRGVLPLWNPHQFCGTPFFANSQSALFYPVNVLFYLPGPLSTAQRFAWVALLHLSLAGAWTYAWLRSLACRRPAAWLAGAAFMLSGFTVTWLELPTFLSAACWIPLLLLAIRQTLHRRSLAWTAVAGLATGLMLLGGHLQIAFYGLLAAAAYALFEAAGRRTTIGEPGMANDDRGMTNVQCPMSNVAVSPIGHWTLVIGHSPVVRRWSFVALHAALALALGFALAAPQLLPAMEMARFSHRAGTPTAEGYRAYVGYAVPLGHLITLYLPDFFGNPKRGDYWGAGNYAEYSGYTGAATLLLALLGVLAGRDRIRATWFLTGMAGLTLWMAAGAPLNALLYFGVPGFGQSGSPGRILVLFCLATAALAGIGLDSFLAAATERGVPVRRLWAPLVAAVGLWGAGFLATRGWAASFVAAHTTLPFRTAWGRSAPSLGLALLLVALAVVAICAGAAGLRSRRLSTDLGMAIAAGVPILVVALDLSFFAAAFLVSAPPGTVYPAAPLTQTIAAAQQKPDGGRMLPLNRDWDLQRAPHAVLPPNAALAYGLDDVQGYDSLYLRRYKELANAIQGGDTSPPENGNMLFLSNVASPLFPLLGVRQLVSAAPRAPEGDGVTPSAGSLLTADPRGLPRAFVVYRWQTASTAGALETLDGLARSSPAALRESAVIEFGVRPAECDLPAATTARATVVERTPNTARVAVESRASGMLIFLENHYPGWRATLVSGGRTLEPTPVLRANHTFRAVSIPAGTSEVNFRFEPACLRVGLFLAALAVAAFGVILASGAVTGLRRTQPPETRP